jgi:ferritin-like metal-binding protein YciE
MTINTVHEKFVFELGAMRDAEERFLAGQEAMLPLASSQQLQMMLREHIDQTQGHIQVLDTVFNLMGLDVQSNKCDAANGLVMEGSKTAAMINDPYVRDCAITGALAKVEHFEIACYRGLITAAERSGQEGIVQYLHQNLMEEEQTAQRLEAYMPRVIDEAMQGETAATVI